ncbi:hypothetical protein [Salipiger mucosus]|uniref:Uncharacterized protein n=1 Tax=Salipiger mucosus DSM 16094 TaxID=1123237 RepID=S9QYN6_9RHOB|nr:hypothetical protein [Salipiger mucosus]EPX84758.1 hypothetical protein Salmuc_01331 [Salipiger mucosus DSM 16094]
MPESQSFKQAVAREIRTHLGREIDPASCVVSQRLDTFLSSTPCGAAHVTPTEAAEQVICGVS